MVYKELIFLVFSTFFAKKLLLLYVFKIPPIFTYMCLYVLKNIIIYYLSSGFCARPEFDDYSIAVGFFGKLSTKTLLLSFFTEQSKKLRIMNYYTGEIFTLLVNNIVS